MSYLTQEELCILWMYMDRNRIRTAGNIIDALEELQACPEELMMRTLLDKITEMTEEKFRTEAGRQLMI